jgi:hypothetical protein
MLGFGDVLIYEVYFCSAFANPLFGFFNYRPSIPRGRCRETLPTMDNGKRVWAPDIVDGFK